MANPLTEATLSSMSRIIPQLDHGVLNDVGGRVAVFDQGKGHGKQLTVERDDRLN